MTSFTIDGLKFDLVPGTPMRFTKWPDGYEALCRVVETAWAYSPEKFVEGVKAHRGASFEGNVSYAFAEEYPEEGFDGVSLDYFDEEQVVSADFFGRFVEAYAKAVPDLSP